VIAGHGRLLAARKLGLTTIPIIVFGHLSETAKRAYILADNKLSTLSTWDDDLLREELAAFDGCDINLETLGCRDLA
jgi:ParB-like chromosome segregation protein Spo0J